MTLRTALGRRGPAVGVMAAGALLVVVGSLLPWVRSGDRSRHSYDLLALVDRLELSGGAAETALRWWPVVPLLATAAVVAAWWGWPRAGGAVGIVAAAYAGVTAVVVSRTPSDLVDVRFGPVVTIGGAIVLVVGSVLALTPRAAGPA